MSGPVVIQTTKLGGVLRTHECREGVSVQCSAGRHHFDAFVKRGDSWTKVVISQGVSAVQPEDQPQAISMDITGDFAKLLADFFHGVCEVGRQLKAQQPETKLDNAHEMLGRAQAEVQALKAELKAVRSHKRKPKAQP